jgi:LuxR family transcriptional regulator, maltose regulon positive regulatory protein
MRSELGTLLNWFEALPEPVLAQHPTQCAFYAALLFRIRRFEAARARLMLAADAELTTTARGIQMALWADLAQVRGDISHAEERAREALALGEVAVAENAGRDVRLPLAATLFAAGCLEKIQANRGQLREAAATAQRGLALAQAALLAPPWTMAVAMLHVDLAGLLDEADNLDGAARHALAAIEIGRQVQYLDCVLRARLVLAWVRLAQGLPATAQDLTQQADRAAQQVIVPLDKANGLSELARAWLAQGSRAAAEACLRQAEQLRDGVEARQPELLSARPELVRYMRARMWLRDGRPDCAAELLAPLRASAEAAGQIRFGMEIMALQALAHQAQGDVQGALASLQPALALAEAEGYVNLLIDEGAAMAALLGSALANGIAPGYVTKLLARLPITPAAGSTASINRRLYPDALSLRELEVLRLVAQGLSNQEIAAKLVIAVGTVKRHTNNIFGKLGAATRIQAVARARERQLL